MRHDGFFLTGDLGYQDEAGSFYFVDRKKDLIIKGGVNIFPGEVEEILYQIAGVQTAVVVGVPDAVFGEEVIAFVKPRDGTVLAEADILHVCREHLHVLKCPRRVFVVAELPVGPSGKLLKQELRRRFAEGARE